MTQKSSTNRVVLQLLGAILLFSFLVNAREILNVQKAEELKKINELELSIKNIALEKSNFYNYSIICGGKDYDSRASLQKIDPTIPKEFYKLIKQTYLDPASRANKCPKWSSNIEMKTGAMERLTIEENTPIGTTVYYLLAADPESQPIYYFIRNLESESPETPIIFNINPSKLGNNWIGEVVLNTKLDYEKKKSYQYLTYAYDGANLIERYTSIDVADVDDEVPRIVTEDNENFNLSSNRFEYFLHENVSIGSVVNAQMPIRFKDMDTQLTQLKVRLVNVDNDMVDMPVSVNNDGEIKLITNLDYETRTDYLLKLIVEDKSGGSDQRLIKINVLDVADLNPKFLEPKQSEQPTEFMFNKIDYHQVYYENQRGPVFNISAISSNLNPLADITYEILPLSKSNDETLLLNTHFQLAQHESNSSWYLNCIKEFHLGETEDQSVAFILRAYESDLLFSDKRVLIRVVNGDLCKPKFDKDVYEFLVVENIKQILEPIYVEDCDNGPNGRIFLSTTNSDFEFKLSEVYKQGKLGIEMKKSYDYEDLLLKNNGSSRIEFEIIAKSSNKSLNQYETRAKIVFELQDLNEFIPQFVKPLPNMYLKNGLPTQQQQKIFFYNVPENQDFNLVVQAKDSDNTGLGKIDYTVKFIDENSQFPILSNYSTELDELNVSVPGRYLSSESRVPIIFLVEVADYGLERLKNEIIIYLRPQSNDVKPVYFEFSKYEFQLSENKFDTFKLKLINENSLNRTKIDLEELDDKLNLFTPNKEANFVTDNDFIGLGDESENPVDDLEIESEFDIGLYLNASKLDLDRLYVENNFSNVYEYRLRARLAERPEIFNDVLVLVRFNDRNDNAPFVRNMENQTAVLEAFVDEDYLHNSLMINIGGDFFLPEFTDLDFSEKYGLESLHFTLNDTRFYVENKYNMESNRNKSLNYVTPLIKIGNADGLDRGSEPFIWLQLTCEDNYFGRKLNKDETFFSKTLLIRVEIRESRMRQIEREMSLFSNVSFSFDIDEGYSGLIGELNNSTETDIIYKFEVNKREDFELISEHFRIESNRLYLKVPFDYEKGQTRVEFGISARKSTTAFEQHVDVTVNINDLNDEAPKFIQSAYKFFIKNHQKTNDLGKLYAIDMDKTDMLTFNILDETITNSNVSIQLSEVTDLENQYLYGVSIDLLSDLEIDEFEFDVQVVDKSGQNSTCHVSIVVAENKIIGGIQWVNETFLANVKENSPEDTFVTQVIAQATEGLKENDISFTIGYKIVNPNEFYKIDESTGVITTTGQSLNREETIKNRALDQSLIFVQSYLTLNSTMTIWSSIERINVEIDDVLDEVPIFQEPSNNQTQLVFDENPVYVFIAEDSDLNDILTYKLNSQFRVYKDQEVNLPFRLDKTSGELSFDFDSLTTEDYANLLSELDSVKGSVRVRLNVEVTDSVNMSSNCFIFVDIPVQKILGQVDERLRFILDNVTNADNEALGFYRINQSTYSIDESMPTGTRFAQVKLALDRFNLTTFNLTLEPLSKELDLYLQFSGEEGNSLKLIRKLDYSLIQAFEFRIRLNEDVVHDFRIIVNDINDKEPELELNHDEVKKYGENLVITSIEDFEPVLNRISKSASSTPKMPIAIQPAIPEMGIPERDFTEQVLSTYRTLELDENTDSLKRFNTRTQLKAYRISDSDLENNFNVTFLQNGTDADILNNYEVKTNGTFITFEKKPNQTEFKNIRNKFSIEIHDGKNRKEYTGEIVNINPQQLERLLINKPKNGRYQASLYRLTDEKRVEIRPRMQIENQFPYDLNVVLGGEDAKYFIVEPKVIKAGSNLGAKEIELILKDSLANYEEELKFKSDLKFEINLRTESNEYLDELLGIIGSLKVTVKLMSRNDFEPRIQLVRPESGDVIRLKEGMYEGVQIAEIKGADRDRHDPERLEYYLIGNSKLLDINLKNGIVTLNGQLDAEQESEIQFYLFARDMDYKPLGRNSNLIKMTIQVEDENEFEPTIYASSPSLTLNETLTGRVQDNETESLHEYTILPNFHLDCYDRDVNSTLNIRLASYGYVNQFDGNVFIDETLYDPTLLESLFKLLVSESHGEETSSNHKRANLAYKTKDLDFERLYRPNETLIRLDFACSDQKFESTARLLIKVDDLNDNAPRFTQKNVTISRKESSQIERIYQTEAFDLDGSFKYGNASLRYSLIRCDPRDLYKIEINHFSGEILSDLRLDIGDIQSQLDKSQLILSNRVECAIRVHDSGNQSDEMSLAIEIENINNSPPVIMSDDSEIVIEVEEGERSRDSILAKISVFDADGTQGLKCVFADGFTRSEPFELRTSVDKYNKNLVWCVLKVQEDKFVDYDTTKRSTYLLDLLVLDTEPTPVPPNIGSATKRIRINVKPVNDKPPKFINGMDETFYILDSNKPGILIGTVSASDMESNNPDSMVYEIDADLTAKDVAAKFELKQVHGSSNAVWGSMGLYTREVLKVDQSPYLVTIRAYDGPVELSDTLYSTKLCVVHVLNKGTVSVWVNSENGMPVDYYKINLREEEPEGSSVVTVRANVPHFYKKIEKEVMVYSIVPDEETKTANPYYKIDANTGLITTTNVTTDYEERNPTKQTEMKNIRVRATSSEGHFSYVTNIIVNLVDINDNAPQFDSLTLRTPIQVSENTTRDAREYVTTLRAHDLDSGINGEILYELLDDASEFLEINSGTGDLYVLNTTSLDREKNATIKIRVKAYNHKELDSVQETIAELSVNLLDINDNAPEFDLTNIKDSYEIEENSIGFSTQVKATDKDFSYNGTVFYTLDHSLNSELVLRSFSINARTGILTLTNRLDFEQAQQLNVTITASDYGAPDSLRSNLVLSIKVIDLNDNQPRFSANLPHKISVIESTPIGQEIFKLIAVDGDMSEKFNQTVFKLRSLQSIDSLGALKTHSEDGIFKINPESGVITLGEEAKLDSAETREFLLHIEAFDKDRKELNDFLNMTVYVEPSKDKQPVFDSGLHKRKARAATLYTRSLDESKPNEYVVDVVKARDPNQYGIKYFVDLIEEVYVNITNGTRNVTSKVNMDLFKIGEEDGILKTNQTRSSYQAQYYIIKVRAVSKLNESLSSIIDLVIDIDKNSDSLFERRVYEKSIDENLEANAVVLQLEPKPSVDQRRLLRYKLNKAYSSDIDWFTIDYISGILKTNESAIGFSKNTSPVDCEKQEEVLISVDVCDVGNENREEVFIENLLVKLRINDLNDNLPQFDFSYDYAPTISEDDNTTISEERLITRFKTFDLDRTEENSLTDYEITSTKNFKMDWFRLEVNESDRTCSLIKLKNNNLDRERFKKFSVQVKAFNRNDKSKYALKDIHVTLTDLNDNEPVITNKLLEISLNEDQVLSIPFYKVEAFDIDEKNTVNSEMVYEILGGNSPYVEINSKTGELSLVKYLDFEKDNNSIVLDIGVRDNGEKPLMSSKQLTINIRNLNDNFPQFTDFPNFDEHKCVLRLYENMEVSSLIWHFKAIDIDQPNSNNLEFRLGEIKTDSKDKTYSEVKFDQIPFSLNATSGELELIRELDRETIDNYLFSIMVLDQEINKVRLNTTLECNIQVLDVNDNKPAFVESISEVYKILPLVNERTQVGWFGAFDLDLEENSTIEFSLNNTYDKLFEIDPKLSYVYMNLRNKQIYLNSVYNLEVVVRDKGRVVQLENRKKVQVEIDQNYFKFRQNENDKLELNVKSLVVINENTANGTQIAKVKVLNSIESILDSQLENKTIELHFKLLTCEDTFMIDETTGDVKIRDSSKLDYEKIKEFIVQVECVETNRLDSLKPKTRMGHINMLVKLTNLNDNPISFHMDKYEYSIVENRAQDLPVDLAGKLIQINDPDLLDGSLDDDESISLELQGEDSIDNFRIVKLARFVYKIEATKAFDYEFKSRYEFVIKANDGVHLTRVPVTVDIIDLNDNRPLFESSSYVFRIDENSPINTFIGQVQAVDFDKTLDNNQTLYQFYNHPDENIFNLDRASGALTVFDSSKLDREMIESFNITIIAYNPNKPEMKDTTNVLIKLNDLNDQVPTFERSIFQVYIREKISKLPHLLMNMTAVDNDLKENGTITYEIIKSQASDLFSIDKKSGKLYLTTFLDADLDETKRVYVLEVRAKDRGGLWSKAAVQVNLIDVNDHEPVFVQPKQSTFDFDENDESVLARELFRVNCVDPDASRSEIEYFLVKDELNNNDSAIFSIDKHSGLVRTSQIFDYEKLNEFRFKVVCKDNGIVFGDNGEQKDKVLSSEMVFTVRVNDLDDNEPLFNERDLETSQTVSETLELDSQIMILPETTDADRLPENRHLRFVVLRGNEEGMFRLNETSGELVLLNELDVAKKDKYELVIKATSKRSVDLVGAKFDLEDHADRSIMRLTLNVVRNKLLIEFVDKNYYANINLLDEDSKQSSDAQKNSQLYKDKAIFYSKSYLINRKLKNAVRFRLDSLEKDKSSTYVRVKDKIAHKLFRVDRADGKVYIDRRELINNGFSVGDSLRLNIIAELYASNNKQHNDDDEESDNDDEDIIDNSLTHFTIRLTDQSYSFLMELKDVSLRDMLLTHLNPMSPKYVGRLFMSMGVKPTIHDLITVKNELAPRGQQQEKVKGLLMQITSRDNINGVERTAGFELDSFLDMLRNHSLKIDQYFEPDSVSFKKAAMKAVQVDRGNDWFDFSRPFYHSWLFWLLFTIILLLFVILITFVFCVKLTVKKNKRGSSRKRSGIVVEYPPGVNPVYHNGGLYKLDKNGKKTKKSSKVLPVDAEAHMYNRKGFAEFGDDFEDQELEMRISDSDEE